jgi:hypothetical protein
VKTADPAAEYAAVEVVTAPWLWGDWRGPVRAFAKLPAPPGPFSFDGWVRADLGPATIGTPAREVRAWMLKAAEDALDALAVAGWLLADFPVMEFAGSLDYAVATTGGGVVQPPQQHSISLRVRFQVVRP